MADENVLREYLIALGFKVDAQSEKRFQGSLEAAAKTAAAVAAGLTAAATAIAATVVKIASGFDDLYFSAQRTNTSVTQIKSLTYALSQIGGTASQATGAIEGIARALRTNPGTESLVRSLGVDTRDASGNLRDTVDILIDMNKALEKKPYYVAAQYAAALGLDEQTFYVIRTRAEEIKKYQEEYRKRAAEMGVDPDKAAKAANELMTNFRDLQMQIGLVIDKIALDLGPTITGYMNELSLWIAKHKDEIIQAVKNISDAFVALAKAIPPAVGALQPLLQGFNDLTQSLIGENGFQAALEIVLLYMTGKWLLGMLGVLGKVNIQLAAAMALVAGAEWLTKDIPRDIKQDPATGLYYNGYSSQPQNGGGGESWWSRRPQWMGGSGGWFGSKSGGKSGKPISATDLSISPEGRALLDTIGATESPGYDVMYGGGKFTDFSDHPRQPKVITSGPNAGRTSTAAGRYQFLASTWDQIKNETGLPDFSPESQDKAAWYLAQKQYKKMTGRDLETDLKSGDKDVIANAGRVLSGTWTSLPGGIEQGQGEGTMIGNFNAALERERAREAANKPAPAPEPPKTKWPDNYKPSTDDYWSPHTSAPLLPDSVVNNSASSKSATLHQKTEINVYGSSDPTITGLQVEKAQGRINNNILSNVQGAVQ
ncbi:phage tail tape measure protein [Kaistia dalseonensis]|uniref:Muramidase (Phage lysozyme) n=1 Tax=Kaistia dalseonensis TaxID=410840 RepID=A0ABU0H7E8_9HYPH|nr:phage tail tape measure protein [Kaistia dalseonensis]MCX5495366.1 phage tail tape measure protein [Kaistia dalseonensis]MDQ0437952.1 muramidase (phage lysozyme) [Kaistia dalseonensis]